MSILLACQGRSSSSNNNNSNNSESYNLQTNLSEKQQEKDSTEVRIMPGHIVMMVTNLDRTVQFYEEHLKFHKTEEVIYDGLRRIVMSASDKHHELVFVAQVNLTLRTFRDEFSY